MLTGATTLMWGSWARISATLMDAPANRNAFGTDEESPKDGHDIGAHDGRKDDRRCGVDAHISYGAEIAFGSRMGEEEHDQEPPWRLADVSAERVEDGKQKKPYRRGEQKDALPSHKV